MYEAVKNISGQQGNWFAWCVIVLMKLHFYCYGIHIYARVCWSKWSGSSLYIYTYQVVRQYYPVIYEMTAFPKLLKASHMLTLYLVNCRYLQHSSHFLLPAIKESDANENTLFVYPGIIKPSALDALYCTW
ncbi:hypothetical protein I7I50_11490 [Histoplasma capsulatum G186AR]|uniref:Uncharacterized protein n=1 Tax=Ajellomyces capsulatus TaxID=5037 RepID=A0A8H7Z5N8_AJECA|nr:hypothetical protein I7I52_02727 [Histoplasma capsulatum]QSS70000.1 hypothetical protein I7I50_11490 [Histoplasma capsulatum G186AR]